MVPDNQQDVTSSATIDFYRKSTLTQSPADPIDLNAASNRTVVLRSVQAAYQGLTIFADGEQFLMYSELGVMAPQTAVIKSISTYEMYGAVDTKKLKDEYYFVSRTGPTQGYLDGTGLERGPILDERGIITDYMVNSVNI